ncbi:DgyrCDS1397 [Dimorphilus gyrociliatus]|uniref:DgyrCDS1397 n=1 Tax=Dimorphilus gyrociliatus TaxID=2664684 RepID=A0A7I8V7E5_9ANNE|nr:DgyrCDS1397 [Dimorphilus gyrociliatus]
MQFRLGGGVFKIKHPQTIVLVIVLTVLTVFMVFSFHDRIDLPTYDDLQLEKRQMLKNKNLNEKDVYMDFDADGAGDDKELLLDYPFRKKNDNKPPIEGNKESVNEGTMPKNKNTLNTDIKEEDTFPKQQEKSNIEYSQPAMKPAYKDRHKIRRKLQEILTYAAPLRPNDEHYNINVTLSDRTSMDRQIRDTRPEVCKTKQYDAKTLPTVAVIIPFFNEALSMLIRTVHSILNRSPDMLLDEIILVDDKSTEIWLQKPLTEYMKLLPKVRVIRNTKRMGLIRSRMVGHRAALADVSIFLDAHCEANEGWLEPMLAYLQKYPKAVVQPYVDGIDTGTIEYLPATEHLHVGAFNWELRYTWLKVPDHKTIFHLNTGEAIDSPTLVGCAIAVTRSFFDEIGGFDEGLEIWGGENLELGFRAWQCGGTVVTLLCSRVGHVFKNFPYKFDGNREQVVTKNLMRVADVWMDGYKKFFYASTFIYEIKNTTFNMAELQSIERWKEHRKHLKCKNFEWYMHNIVPEMETPPRDAHFYGEIMNVRSKACFELYNDYYIGMNYICYEHKVIPYNFFSISNAGLLRWKDKCIKVLFPSPALRLVDCPPIDANTSALYDFGIFKVKLIGNTLYLFANYTSNNPR